MTSKDKAKELVGRFENLGVTDNYLEPFEARKAALICVDEIIKSLYKLPSLNDIVDSRQAGGYWEEVKQEIEKL